MHRGVLQNGIKPRALLIAGGAVLRYFKTNYGRAMAQSLLSRATSLPQLQDLCCGDSNGACMLDLSSSTARYVTLQN